MKNALCAAGLGMLLATAAPAQDRATIERLNEAFSAAFRQGDMAALAGMYTEDADLLPHGADMVRGRSAIQAFWTKTREAARAGGGTRDRHLPTEDAGLAAAGDRRQIRRHLAQGRR